MQSYHPGKRVIPIVTMIIVFQAVLGIFFMFTGTRIIFKRLGLPSFFNFMTGSIEIAGAMGMFAGFWFPTAAFVSGLLLGVTMLVAAFMLIVMAGDPFGKALPAILLSVLSLATAAAIYML